MTLRLQPYAAVLGPGRLRVFLDSASAVDHALLDSASWQLSRLNDAGSWDSLPDVIRTLWPYPSATSARELHLSLEETSGVLRLVCVHADVDPLACTAYVCADASLYAPYYLEIEGLNLDGSAHVPSLYFDSRAPAPALAQSLEEKESVAQAGHVSFSLVDVDNRLTRVFAPRRLTAATGLAIEAFVTDTSLYVSDSASLPDSGFLWIGREAISYTSKSGLQLQGVTRGALRTAIQHHPTGAACYTQNPFLKGRWITWRRAIATRHSDNDPILFRGILDDVSPSGDNLACYTLSAGDTTSLLDQSLSTRLPGIPLYSGLAIQADTSADSRHGNDTLYFLRQIPGATNSSLFRVRLPHGLYLSDTAHLSHPLHIARVLETALQSAFSDLLVGVTQDTSGRLLVTLLLKGSLRCVSAAYAGQGADDSALEALGFKEEDGDTWSSEGDSFASIEWKASGAPLGGMDSRCRQAWLDTSLMTNADIARFGLHSLFRIEDEIIHAAEFDWHTSAPASTLADPLTADATSLRLLSASGFPTQGYLTIDAEIIGYTLRDNADELLNLARGAFATTPSAHAQGAAVSLKTWPRLLGVSRGYLGTTAAKHDGGVTAQTLAHAYTFDTATPPVATSLSPAEFLLRLLDATRDDGLDACPAPPDWINTDSFVRALSESSSAFDGSFSRLVSADETYRDVVDDVAQSFNVRLYSDSQGRLALRPRRAVLLHETLTTSLSDSHYIEAPSLSWKENQLIPGLTFDLSYDPVADIYAVRLQVSNENGQSGLSSDEWLSVSSKCLHLNANSPSNWARDWALSLLAYRARFSMVLEASLPLSAMPPLALLDRVRVSSAYLPSGDGTRGFSAKPFEITSLENRPQEASVQVTLTELPDGRYAGFAPSWRVESYVTTSRTVTLSAAGWWDSELTLTDVLQPGDLLVLTRISGASWTQSAAFTFAASGFRHNLWQSQGLFSLVLPSALGFTPQTGDTLTFTAYSTGTAGLPRAFAYFANTSDQLGNGDAAFVYAP